MHTRHLRQLLLEGGVITLIAASGLVIGRQATNSATAARLATVPVVGTGVRGLQALFNAATGH